MSHRGDLPDCSVVLRLSEVAEKYAQSVPFRFKVMSGFMAENEKDPTLGVDEVYSLHLVREIKVVVMEHGGQEFEVPLNSTAKFGLIPSTISYRNMVEDLLKLKPLPHVISVVDKYVHPDGILCLSKNELLLVKEVVKGKFGHSKSGLKVFRLTLHEDLILSKDCHAQFTTDPEATKLYLTDLIDNSINFMPSKAKIYPEETSSLAGLYSSTILIRKQEVHRSVVISLYRENPRAKRKKGSRFIDVPTSINIRLSIIKTEKSNEAYKKIFKESENLIKDYNPSKIQACVDAHTDDQYMTQAQLLAEIRKEKAKKEMTDTAPQHYQQLLLTKPKEESSYQEWTPPLQEKRVITDQQASTSNSPPLPVLPKKPASELKSHHVKATTPSSSTTPPDIGARSKLPTGASSSMLPHGIGMHSKPPLTTPRPPAHSVGALSKPLLPIPAASNPTPAGVGAHSKFPLPALPAPLSPLSQHSSNKNTAGGNDTRGGKTEQLYEDLDAIPKTNSSAVVSEKAMRQVQTTLLTILSQIDELKGRQDQLEKEISAVKKSSESLRVDRSNITIKANMRSAEVLKALDTIGLSQYKEVFSREAVDGEMFQMLDDDILSTELGVNSRLHRVRLLKMKEL